MIRGRSPSGVRIMTPLCAIALFIVCLVFSVANDGFDRKKYERDEERRRKLRTGELVPGVNYFGNPDC
jgi:hypothetical protein